MSKTFIWIPECDWVKAPSLICSAKPTSKAGLFQISILHPNLNKDGTRNVVYTAEIKAKTFLEALQKAQDVKNEQLRHIKTQFEEIKFIPRPKRGKMKLKLKDDQPEKPKKK